MRNFLATLLFCAVLAVSAGCTMVSSMRGMMARTAGALRPTSADGWDPGSETGDPWVQQAGAEARGNQPFEKSADPLHLRNVFMSAKARDIEHNLGVE